MSSDSVKVCDLELEELAELAECWDEIDSILNQYSNIMKKVHEEAIKAGHIHSAVGNLYHFSTRFHNFAEGLGTEASKYAKKLVSKVEDIDLNLYNEV